MNTTDPTGRSGPENHEEEGHLLGTTSEAAPEPAERPLRRLTPLQFGLCLAIPIATFLFLTGPIWSHPWETDLIDTAIWYSYLPLPLLVLACLAWSRRLTVRAFLLDVLTLTLVKYSVTFSIALVLWSMSEPPKLAVLRQLPLGPYVVAAEQPPPATPISPESTGAVRGRVVDAAGRPAAGALVFVKEGLEGHVFAPPKEPLLLENDGAGFAPRLSAVQTHQVISARSTDGRLHALVAADAGGPLFNVPLLSSGVRSSVMVREPHGVSRLRCAVHQGEAEAESHLAVLSHPFFAITAEDGRFSWSGVPAGQLRVAVFHPGFGETAAPADLKPGGDIDLDLRLGSSR